jgi:hypothetical protein
VSVSLGRTREPDTDQRPGTFASPVESTAPVVDGRIVRDPFERVRSHRCRTRTRGCECRQQEYRNPTPKSAHMAECELCGKELDAERMTDEREADGETVYLCCPQCVEDYEG